MNLHPALRSLLLDHGELHPHTLACLLKWHWDIDTTGAEVKRALVSERGRRAAGFGSPVDS